jgi:hypothetical protein
MTPKLRPLDLNQNDVTVDHSKPFYEMQRQTVVEKAK